MYRKPDFYKGRTNNQKEKTRARATKAWKELKDTVVLRYGGLDPLTRSPLRKGWNLHHCDMRKEHYADFNPEKFLPLNNRTHEFVHWFYSYWRNDRKMIDRLALVMQVMERANGGLI